MPSIESQKPSESRSRKKECFAIVASEPLATLIGWVVSEQKSELPDPSACCGEEARVQFFHCGSEISEHPLERFTGTDTLVEVRSPFYSPAEAETNGNGRDRKSRSNGEGGAE